ncbi:hypothetical protein GCM10011487_18840 [Steroidobacter agaridevorans]|uniref:Lipoprotein n=1 Tax=Steroidobacter agaridevorans TaxID=2695856 RepID=A0A829Y971_9GAMM|nr:hypothetical protein [Steroidobacter agaridevorans]GFE79884.1 hypothetical protein GCM10011487_18840 [Steroidobacter agaridevorans]
MKYSALLLTLMLAGCAAQPTVKSWMDPKSSVTITAQTEPLVLIRAQPAPSLNERDYAQLTAIEVNRMGERKLYLVAILWGSSEPWSDESGTFKSAFKQVEVNLGDRSVALTPHTGEVSELGISQALPLPIPGSSQIYFPISRDDLRAISNSTRIELTARGIPEAPRRYEEWQDGRRSLNDFLGQLPETNRPQS